MRLSFSTLACPDWTMRQIIAIAAASGYAGIELRFVEGEDALWRLPAFREELAATKRALRDHDLTISCVDTSCRFHFPDATERAKWNSEGERMINLAAELEAPAIRVFGDTIQSGGDRETTRNWIAENIHLLAGHGNPLDVAVWLETHGDFASGPETMAILKGAGPNTGIIWDPANCFLEASEAPREGARTMDAAIRHVHVKDLRDGKPVLTGKGNFPLSDVRDSLNEIGYDGFLSFEWEKKWHPEIESAEIALPQFVRWYEEHWHHA